MQQFPCRRWLLLPLSTVCNILSYSILIFPYFNFYVSVSRLQLSQVWQYHICSSVLFLSVSFDSGIILALFYKLNITNLSDKLNITNLSDYLILTLQYIFSSIFPFSFLLLSFPFVSSCYYMSILSTFLLLLLLLFRIQLSSPYLISFLFLSFLCLFYVGIF